MTKFVKCIDNSGYEKYLTKGKIYEVEVESQRQVFIKNDIGYKAWYFLHRFEEVKQEEKPTNKFCFIPKSEITEVTIDGIEGILIKMT